MAEYVYGERLIDVSGTDDGPWIEKRVVTERRERVVRCRDCASYRDCGISHEPRCERSIGTFVPTPDGFCAWGEPREEE